MNGLVNGANADELVLYYERAIVAGDSTHAQNIRFAHADLTERFDAIDARFATK